MQFTPWRTAWARNGSEGLELEGERKGVSRSPPKDPFRLLCSKQMRSQDFSLLLPVRNTAIHRKGKKMLPGKQISQALSEGLMCGKACLH